MHILEGLVTRYVTSLTHYVTYKLQLTLYVTLLSTSGQA